MIALWRACGNRAGRREYSLVTNCMRTIDKKVDNPENQSWVNVGFGLNKILFIHRNHKLNK